ARSSMQKQLEAERHRTLRYKELLYNQKELGPELISLEKQLKMKQDDWIESCKEAGKLEQENSELRADLDKLSSLWNCGIPEKRTMNEIRGKWSPDNNNKEK